MGIAELEGIDGAGPRLLQIARSTPGLISTLVGHKSQEHVLANIALSSKQPLTQPELAAVMSAVGT